MIKTNGPRRARSLLKVASFRLMAQELDRFATHGTRSSKSPEENS